MKSIAFFGHRAIYNDDIISERLNNTLKSVISKGFSRLIVGSHGDFDKLALSVCLNYKKSIDNEIQINVVLTNLSSLNRGKRGYSQADIVNDMGCEPIFYDVEEEHYKNRITVCNKKMVDDSDLIICYVDMRKYVSGAKKAVNYALKQNKRVINLFMEEDIVRTIKNYK